MFPNIGIPESLYLRALCTLRMPGYITIVCVCAPCACENTRIHGMYSYCVFHMWRKKSLGSPGTEASAHQLGGS